MADSNIFFIDPTYIKYRRMWKQDRWRFSGDLVKLTAKQTREQLSNEEQHALDVMNRVVDENDGKWLDGYEYKNEYHSFKKSIK